MTSFTLPQILKPKYTYDLIRLGSNHDGGYLVEKSSVIKCEHLFSFGIATNWIFEKDFIKYNNVKLLAFDGSINSDFWRNQKKIAISKAKKLSFNKLYEYFINKIQFEKFFNEKNFVPKFVGTTLPNSMSLDSIIELSNKSKNFLKIDIEGSEYEILDSILYNQKKIIGLVIEFHDCNSNLKKIINFIKSLELDLVHIHANNYIQTKYKVPDILEISFSRNPIVLEDFKSLPHKFDRPNKQTLKELVLNFEE